MDGCWNRCGCGVGIRWKKEKKGMEKAIREKKRRSISSYIWAIDQDHQNPILLTVSVKRVSSSSDHEWDDEREYWDEKESTVNPRCSSFFGKKKIVLFQFFFFCLSLV